MVDNKFFVITIDGTDCAIWELNETQQTKGQVILF
jgi:hypothetical protein